MTDAAMRRLAVRLMVVAAAMIPLWAVIAIIGGVIVDLTVSIIIGALVLPVGIGFVVVACRRVREVGSGVQSAAATPPGHGSEQVEAPGREPHGYDLSAYGAPAAGAGPVPHTHPHRPTEGEAARDHAIARRWDRLQMAGGTMTAVFGLVAVIVGAITLDTGFAISGLVCLAGGGLVIGSAQVQLRARHSGGDRNAVADPRWTNTGAVEPPAAHPPVPTTPATPVDGPTRWQQPPGPRMQR